MPSQHAILAVEDEATHRQLIELVLAEAGYSVSFAEQAAQVPELLQAGVSDLLLLDPTLPDMDGLELIARVRQSSSIPIVVLSATTDDEHRALAAAPARMTTCRNSPWSRNSFLRVSARSRPLTAASRLSRQHRADPAEKPLVVERLPHRGVRAQLLAGHLRSVRGEKQHRRD